jgi:hypothetical protein
VWLLVLRVRSLPAVCFAGTMCWPYRPSCWVNLWTGDRNRIDFPSQVRPRQTPCDRPALRRHRRSATPLANGGSTTGASSAGCWPTMGTRRGCGAWTWSGSIHAPSGIGCAGQRNNVALIRSRRGVCVTRKVRSVLVHVDNAHMIRSHVVRKAFVSP